MMAGTIIYIAWRKLKKRFCNYTFEKRYYVFNLITRFVCVCVCFCLSVITFMMAGPSNTVLLGPNTLSQNLKMQLYTPQDDPFPFPFHMDRSDKITFGL